MQRLVTSRLPLARRPWPAWTGLALLALWGAWSVSGLMALATPLPGDSPARILQRLGALAPGVPLSGRATLFQLPAPGCGCAAAGAASVPDGLRVVDLAGGAPAADLPYPLMVVAADGRLVYAGPRLIAQGCGEPVPAARLIPRLLARVQPPLVLASPCACPEELPA